MFLQWQAAEGKVKYIPWISILLIMVVFILVEERTFLKAPPYDSGFYTSQGAAEIIATSTEEGSVPRRAGLAMLGCFGVFCLWRPLTGRFQINGALGLLLILFLGWAALSTAWAEDPALTSRRVLIFVILSLGALGFACRYSLEDVLWLAFIGSGVLVLAGVLGELYRGGFTPFAPDYRFAGGLHPNHQGWTCGLLLLSSLILGGKESRHRLFFRFSGLLALALLLLTKSRIAMGSTVLVLLLYWHYTWPRRNRIVTVLLAASFFCLLFIFLQNHLADYTKAGLSMGRADSDLSELSGRLPLWQELARYASRRIFTGYGFDAFWTPEHILAVSDRMEWAVPGAHSGVLELVLGVGIIGAILFLAIIFITLKTLMRTWLSSHDRLYLFSFLSVLFYFSIMLGEEIFSSSSFPGFIVGIILMKFGLTTPYSPAAEGEMAGSLSGELRLI